MIVTPARQTVLLAKQAAELDILTGGRMRLGVGVGGNREEYAALNQDFRGRGARVEEQIELLRALWTEESVDFAGRWDAVRGAGLAPLPIQRPIPIWIGASGVPVPRIRQAYRPPGGRLVRPVLAGRLSRDQGGHRRGGQ